jgi:multiple sugar transport system ATP-binding protein
MHDGRVEQIGEPLALYDAPQNLFVAGFIGSPAMNLLRGIHRREGGASAVELEGGGRLPAPPSSAGDGARVVFGVRPEHLLPAQAGEGLEGEVVVVEPTGADTQVILRAAGTELIAVFRERHALAPGQKLRVRVDAARAHLFDAESGTRL